ncbi:kinase-like protein [Daldinia sp. FL1419]|nr:kinase-like protein [Daldinia sp. FL1419]
MIRRPSVSQVLVSLKPLNSRARGAVSHKYNEGYTSKKHGERCFCFSSPSQYSSLKVISLPSIGSSRSHADVYVSGSDISAKHLSFYINYRTGITVVEDKSGGNTRVYQDKNSSTDRMSPGKYATAALTKGLNGVLSIGSRNDPANFEIIWEVGTDTMMEVVRKRIAALPKPPPDEDIYIYTDQVYWKQPPKPIKHFPVAELGRGGFGKVMKTIDSYTGGVMAVKKLFRPMDDRSNDWIDTLVTARDREVFLLSKLKHGHIVEYLGSQGWDTGVVEIFMPMKRGTLAQFVRKYPSYSDVQKTGNVVLLQMLSALDYLDYHRLIHRDVKPENILYDVKRVNGEEHEVFQLADFGLSVLQDLGRSFAGTKPFMAPEVYDGARQQTPKVDIWSLYATMLWVYNEGLFRHRVESGRLDRHSYASAAILNIASTSKDLRYLRSMAIYDPSLRASAAQMLTGLKRQDLMTSKAPGPMHSYSEWMQSVKAGKSTYSSYLTQIMEQPFY